MLFRSADVKASLRAQLDHTSIQEPDGTIHKVTRRTDAKKPRRKDPMELYSSLILGFDIACTG